MVLEIYYVDELRRSTGYPNGKHYLRCAALVQCDGCGVKFERPESSIHEPQQFCTRDCANRANIPVRAETNLVKYGFICPMSQPQVKERANSLEACAQRHETTKRNGTFRKSKPEDALYELLCQHFSTVERQVTIPGTRWSIDFYVKSIDIYVQFDGVYWHGLDRSIELIGGHRSSRDAVIHKKFLTDRAQDTWFKATGKRLVRITDREFKQMESDVLQKLVTVVAA
jgi:very-short-patch-repair endonuclease